MSQADALFSGSIPALYEKLLVPMFFAPYAQDMTRRVVARHPKRILELAAGTGVVTRAMAKALPEARIVATDLNEGMIEVGRRAASSDHVRWRQADAGSLPFADESFDVVVCQFGAMFFPDKPHAFGEARRVLSPGGAFLFSVWDRLDKNEFSDEATKAVAALFPDNPPNFLGRIPHGYFDIGAIERDLVAGGFESVGFDTLEERSRSANARDVAIGLMQGTPMRSEIEARDPQKLEAATDRAAAALEQCFGNGAIEGLMQAIVVTAQRA